MGRVGKVGVSERDRTAPSCEHAGPHRRALSPVLGLHDHLVGTSTASSVGGAIRRTVVDHDDLEISGEHVEFVADAGDGVGDALLFPVRRNDHTYPHLAVRRRAVYRNGLLTTHHAEKHEPM